MYQEDFHLSHYRQFLSRLPPEHTENGQSIRLSPIRKVNLRGWPLNSDIGKPSFSYCDKWTSSWYIGTKIEEIDDELVIKLSVWKKRSWNRRRTLLDLPSSKYPDRENRGIEGKGNFIIDLRCYKLFHCTGGPMGKARRTDGRTHPLTQPHLWLLYIHLNAVARG